MDIRSSPAELLSPQHHPVLQTALSFKDVAKGQAERQMSVLQRVKAMETNMVQTNIIPVKRSPASSAQAPSNTSPEANQKPGSTPKPGPDSTSRWSQSDPLVRAASAGVYSSHGSNHRIHSSISADLKLSAANEEESPTPDSPLIVATPEARRLSLNLPTASLLSVFQGPNSPPSVSQMKDIYQSGPASHIQHENVPPERCKLHLDDEIALPPQRAALDLDLLAKELSVVRAESSAALLRASLYRTPERPGAPIATKGLSIASVASDTRRPTDTEVQVSELRSAPHNAPPVGSTRGHVDESEHAPTRMSDIQSVAAPSQPREEQHAHTEKAKGKLARVSGQGHAVDQPNSVAGQGSDSRSEATKEILRMIDGLIQPQTRNRPPTPTRKTMRSATPDSEGSYIVPPAMRRSLHFFASSKESYGSSPRSDVYEDDAMRFPSDKAYHVDDTTRSNKIFEDEDNDATAPGWLGLIPDEAWQESRNSPGAMLGTGPVEYPGFEPKGLGWESISVSKDKGAEDQFALEKLLLARTHGQGIDIDIDLGKQYEIDSVILSNSRSVHEMLKAREEIAHNGCINDVWEQVIRALSFSVQPQESAPTQQPQGTWPEFQTQHYVLEHGGEVLREVVDGNQQFVRQLQPIHEAASLGSVSILSYLVNSTDTDVNLPTPDGNTPLHIAAYEGHGNAIEFLLSCGADPWIRNKQGFSAVEILTSSSQQWSLLAQGAHHLQNAALKVLGAQVGISLAELRGRFRRLSGAALAALDERGPVRLNAANELVRVCAAYDFLKNGKGSRHPRTLEWARAFCRLELLGADLCTDWVLSSCLSEARLRSLTVDEMNDLGLSLESSFQVHEALSAFEGKQGLEYWLNFNGLHADVMSMLDEHGVGSLAALQGLSEEELKKCVPKVGFRRKLTALLKRDRIKAGPLGRERDTLALAAAMRNVTGHAKGLEELHHLREKILEASPESAKKGGEESSSQRKRELQDPFKDSESKSAPEVPGDQGLGSSSRVSRTWSKLFAMNKEGQEGAESAKMKLREPEIESVEKLIHLMRRDTSLQVEMRERTKKWRRTARNLRDSLSDVSEELARERQEKEEIMAAMREMEKAAIEREGQMAHLRVLSGMGKGERISESMMRVLDLEGELARTKKQVSLERIENEKLCVALERATEAAAAAKMAAKGDVKSHVIALRNANAAWRESVHEVDQRDHVIMRLTEWLYKTQAAYLHMLHSLDRIPLNVSSLGWKLGIAERKNVILEGRLAEVRAEAWRAEKDLGEARELLEREKLRVRRHMQETFFTKGSLSKAYSDVGDITTRSAALGSPRFYEEPRKSPPRDADTPQVHNRSPSPARGLMQDHIVNPEMKVDSQTATPRRNMKVFDKASEIYRAMPAQGDVGSESARLSSLRNKMGYTGVAMKQELSERGLSEKGLAHGDQDETSQQTSTHAQGRNAVVVSVSAYTNHSLTQGRSAAATFQLPPPHPSGTKLPSSSLEDFTHDQEHAKKEHAKKARQAVESLVKHKEASPPSSPAISQKESVRMQDSPMSAYALSGVATPLDLSPRKSLRDFPLLKFGGPPPRDPPQLTQIVHSPEINQMMDSLLASGSEGGTPEPVQSVSQRRSPNIAIEFAKPPETLHLPAQGANLAATSNYSSEQDIEKYRGATDEYIINDDSALTAALKARNKVAVEAFSEVHADNMPFPEVEMFHLLAHEVDEDPSKVLFPDVELSTIPFPEVSDGTKAKDHGKDEAGEEIQVQGEAGKKKGREVSPEIQRVTDWVIKGSGRPSFVGSQQECPPSRRSPSPAAEGARGSPPLEFGIWNVSPTTKDKNSGSKSPVPSSGDLRRSTSEGTLDFGVWGANIASHPSPRISADATHKSSMQPCSPTRIADRITSADLFSLAQEIKMTSQQSPRPASPPRDARAAALRDQIAAKHRARTSLPQSESTTRMGPSQQSGLLTPSVVPGPEGNDSKTFSAEKERSSDEERNFSPEKKKGGSRTAITSASVRENSPPETRAAFLDSQRFPEPRSFCSPQKEKKGKPGASSSEKSPDTAVRRTNRATNTIIPPQPAHLSEPSAFTLVTSPAKARKSTSPADTGAAASSLRQEAGGSAKKKPTVRDRLKTLGRLPIHGKVYQAAKPSTSKQGDTNFM